MPFSRLIRQYWVVCLAIFVFLAGAVFHVAAAEPSQLQVTSPAPESTVYGNSVTVSFSLANFKLVDFKTYSRPVTDQGHIHLWLDQDQLTKESAIKVISDSYTFENLKAGDHTLTAELVNNDHSSFNPSVKTVVSFATRDLPSPSTSLLTFPVFQLSVFTVIMLLLALYFTNLHISSLKSSKPVSTSKTKSKKRRLNKH